MSIPKKVTRAFFPKAIAITALDGSKITLREFSIATLLFLSAIEHPLATGAAVVTEKGRSGIKLTHKQTLELLYVLTRPVEECKAALDNGDDEFDSAVLKFADTLPVRELGKIRTAVLDAFARAWETALATIPEGEKKTS